MLQQDGKLFSSMDDRKSKREALESTSLRWWSIADSNRLPRHCQCRALPDELIPLYFLTGCNILSYSPGLANKSATVSIALSFFNPAITTPF